MSHLLAWLRYSEILGELAPVVDAADDFPVIIAVVHDEEFASGFADPLRGQETSDLPKFGYGSVS
jgi:hypothetical protein